MGILIYFVEKHSMGLEVVVKHGRFEILLGYADIL